jgi:dTDP-4-amino-4,6-dideoxygalactose transaminase
MTDVAAALGIHQLSEADSLWNKRRAAVKRYHVLLKNIPGLTLPVELPGCKSAWHLYSIRVDHGRTSRDALVRFLAEEGILTSVHFIPLHLHPFYRNKYGYREKDFPSAYRSFLGSVTLPLFPSMSEKEQRRVAEKIREFCI